MSWSVSAVGKPKAVAADIESQFQSLSACNQPEESAKQYVRQAIAILLTHQSDQSPVKVSASGSQGQEGTKSTNTVNFQFESIYRFLE